MKFLNNQEVSDKVAQFLKFLRASLFEKRDAAKDGTSSSALVLVIVFALVFCVVAASSLDAVFRDLNSSFWLGLYAWVFGALIVQCVALRVFLGFLGNKVIQAATLAALGTFATYALNFSLAEWFVKNTENQISRPINN